MNLKPPPRHIVHIRVIYSEVIVRKVSILNLHEMMTVSVIWMYNIFTRNIIGLGQAVKIPYAKFMNCQILQPNFVVRFFPILKSDFLVSDSHLYLLLKLMIPH